MNRRAQIILLSFAVMLGLSWGLSRLLSGGEDVAIVGRSLDKLKETRNFTGMVSVAAVLPVEGRGLRPVILTATGRFGVPVGKALVGSWSVETSGVEAEGQDEIAVDMAVDEAGKMFLRPNSLPEWLDLPSAWLKAEGKWIATDAKDLWPAEDVSSAMTDASAAWNELFDLATSGRALRLLGRAMSEPVVGEPCWHFVMGVTPSATARFAELTAALRTGHEPDVAAREVLATSATSAAPKVDLWIAKASGELRQAVVSYIGAADSDSEGTSRQPVIVTLRFAAYPSYEPVQPPSGAVQVAPLPSSGGQAAPSGE
jgi:hypothetical protein